MVARSTGLPERVHCVGVSGGGLSALARLLRECGHVVSGSDRGGVRPELLAAGIESAPSGDPSLAVGADLLVRSAAVPEDDGEVAAARAAGVPVLKYAEALGRVMAGRRGVAVAGTHGKTTTTALLAHLLRVAGRAPAWIVGGAPADFPAFGWGRGELMVVEACEFDLSFLQLRYDVALITGVTADHLDCFGDLAGVQAAFRAFARRLPPGGTLLLGPGVPAELDFALGPEVSVVRVDELCALLEARADSDGFTADVRLDDGRSMSLRCGLWGRHNLDNARCALATARVLGVPWDIVAAALPAFAGVARRLTDRGDLSLPSGRARLIDDFAHHPDALSAAAEALAAHLPGRRRVGLFQPHQVSRTEEFLDAFARALQQFDAVGLCDIFVARDARPERAGEVLAELARRGGGHVQRLGPACSAAPAVRALLRPDDACVIMGAGDIDGLAGRLAGTPAGP